MHRIFRFTQNLAYSVAMIDFLKCFHVLRKHKLEIFLNGLKGFLYSFSFFTVAYILWAYIYNKKKCLYFFFRYADVSITIKQFVTIKSLGFLLCLSFKHFYFFLFLYFSAEKRNLLFQRKISNINYFYDSRFLNKYFRGVLLSDVKSIFR